MAGHTFAPAPGLQAEIERVAPTRFCTNRGEYAKLVKANARWVRSGDPTTLPPVPQTEIFRCPAEPPEDVEPARFGVTEVCVVNADTLTAALVVEDSIALNFANASTPGGGYLHGAAAQEEDLCRLLPQLHPSLVNCPAYPIRPDTALVTRGLLAVRQAGTYEPLSAGPNNDGVPECSMVTSAMPAHNPRPGSPEWNTTVRLRIRAVLHASKQAGYPNLILGAFGCGAFGNPPDLVARMFVEQLRSPEFAGSFSRVVFAIIDPKKDGNLEVFRREIQNMTRDA